MSDYAFENTHYNSLKKKPMLSMLIDNPQSHLSPRCTFFPDILANSQNMRKLKNNIKTLGTVILVSHNKGREDSGLQRIQQGRDLNINTEIPCYVLTEIGEVLLLSLFLTRPKLCGTATISGKKYINVKV